MAVAGGIPLADRITRQKRTREANLKMGLAAALRREFGGHEVVKNPVLRECPAGILVAQGFFGRGRLQIGDRPGQV